jgi:LacI family transcriptional regulator
MATIRDVAKEAGVSVGTVSNVLNDIPCVSDKKVKQVRDAIEKLGYRRNNLASQLRSNVSNTIGLIVPDITNPFYSEIARS